jgi:nuclear cap-binding protein subunit 1
MLHELRASDYASPEVLPRPVDQAIDNLPEGTTLFDPYTVSSVSMPPEMYDPDEENPQECEGQMGGLRLFADDIIMPTTTVSGWTLRSLVHDVITIFEVNRKEAARLLLALPRYITGGTFKSEGSESTLSLESLVINTMLSTMLTLPHPPQKLIYYGSVITELCKLSPNTIAPPVGRAVRKIFTFMGEPGLDIEIARRTAEWFAMHLSNFGFQWMWKEWIPDLELAAAHPRRAFMRHVVELEIRLAYHDRILQTLPDPMLPKEAAVVSEDAPDPVWVYESPSHALHTEAAELAGMMRHKVTAGETLDFLDKVPGARADGGETLSVPVLMMAVETVQHLGSRSFSHFLNATERYLDVLRHISPDGASRRVLLDAIKSFWRRSSQMRLLTIDKYLQYGILEPIDVVEWLFTDERTFSSSDAAGDGWTDCDNWDLLRMTLDKVVGRVVAVRRRLRAVDKADEVARARRAAERLDRGDMPDDEDLDVERSREGRDVQASLDVQTARLEKVFSVVVERFVAQLLPADDAHGLGLKGVLALLDSGEVAAWPVRARFGWWREFVRRYAVHIEPLAEHIEATVFAAPVEGDADSAEVRAHALVRGVWAEALGRD